MTDTRIALTLMFATNDKPSIVATRVGEVVAAEVATPLIGMNWSAFDLSDDDAEDEPDWETIAKDRETERDGAYRERAQLLALLASLHPSVIAPAPDVDEDGWQILYLWIGGRQASWHIAPRDAQLFAHVEHVPADDLRAQWDGHTSEQKYAHIGQHAARLYAEARSHVEAPLKPDALPQGDR